MNIPNTDLKRIIIIGAGFSGLDFIKYLNHSKFQIIVIDKNNYHTFQPLLYQVATCGLELESIIHPVRPIITKYKNCFFILAEVSFVDSLNNKIISDAGELYYDFLILANGSRTNFFGKKNIEKFSLPMKFVNEALNLRSYILKNFEKASLLKLNDAEFDKLMTFVVVGGGPTGVELSGSLAELKNYILPKDYSSIDFSKMCIYLLQASSKLLDGMSDYAAKSSLDYLRGMGVKVYLNTCVDDYDGHTVNISSKLDFNQICTYNVIWAAGVTGSIINGMDNCIVKKGRIKVNSYNKVKNYKNIFAIGDIAFMTEDDRYPSGHPMTIQPALQQAKNLSKNFNNMILGKKMIPFKYRDIGSMATISRNKAVCDLPFIKFKGFIAWFIWIIVHLFNIIGFRNKLIIFINWVTQYFSYNKGIRIIFKNKKNS